MPKYTNDSLEVDSFIADVAKIKDDIEYATARSRYLRVSAFQCRVLSAFTIGYPTGVAGRPIRATLTAGTEDAFYYAHLQLPFGVLLLSVYIIHKEPGTETSRSTLAVRRVDPTGDTTLKSANITHSNGAQVVTKVDVGGLNYDTQLTADPTVPTDFEFIELEFRQLWDTVAAGSQDHDFYGFIFEYRMDPAAPTRAVLRERT